MFFKKNKNITYTGVVFFININNEMGSTRVSLHRPDLLFAICLDKWSVIESTIYWGELDIYIALWKTFLCILFKYKKKTQKQTKASVVYNHTDTCTFAMLLSGILSVETIERLWECVNVTL